MKIQGTAPYNKSNRPNKQYQLKKAAAPAFKDTFQPAASAKTGTYNRQGKITDTYTLEKLKEEHEHRFASLRLLVEKLLQQQNESAKIASGKLKINETTKTEAARLIAEGGLLSAENLSDSIVNYAKALTGDDPAKISIMRDAITEGFRRAETELGGLPEISLKTRELVMQKLDAWETESNK